MTFEEWCEQEGLDYLSDRVDVRYIWESAQQDERERIVTLICDNPELFSEGGFAALLNGVNSDV